MAIIPLGGAYSHLLVLVDDDKHGWLSQHTWYRCGPKDGSRNYAMSYVGGRYITMHRLLMDPPRGIEVDHRNHNGLDNRLENLRFATRSQNRHNSRTAKTNRLGFKGVSYERGNRRKPYRAQIYIDKKIKVLGRFATPEEAAAAYDAAAVEFFGEFAHTNSMEIA